MRQTEHPRFKRKVNDVLCFQEITLVEALTGGKFTLEYLCGQKYNLILEKKKIIKPGGVAVIEGLGMPVFKAPSTYGKLYMIFNIKFPKVIGEERSEKLSGVYIYIGS